MKILCIEDDYYLAKLIETTLVQQHYQVELASDGEMGWNLAETYTYDLILLDLILPKLDGFRFCQKLRSPQSSSLNPNWETPVLLMTAVETVTNKVMGLDAGADDYVVKPFNLEELSARIRALLRRNQGRRTLLLTWGELCLNPNNCEVTYQGQPIILTSKEYELLELFLRNPNQIFNLDRLLERLWTTDEFPTEGTVRAHIKGLRKKLKQSGVENILETIYKLGYRLKSPDSLAKEAKPKKQKKKPKIEEQTGIVPEISVSGVLPQLEALWQECRPSYCDRLNRIQQAVIALEQNNLTPEIQHQAEREAHTLIGSLGSFGFEEASHLCRKIQQILQRQEPLDTVAAQQLKQLIATVEQHINENQPLFVENPTRERRKEQGTNQYSVAESTSPNSPTSDNPAQAILNPTTGNPLIAAKISVLIVDDDLPLARKIAIEALNWGIEASIASNLKQAEQLLSQTHFDGLILDLNFSTPGESGLDFLRRIRHQYPQIAIVMLTAEDAFATRVEAARLGSQCFLQKPLAPTQILAAVTQVLQQANLPAPRLLVVDDDPQLLHLLEQLLTSSGYQVTVLEQPEQFWQTLEQTTPELLIVDIELGNRFSSNTQTEISTLPALSGLDLCQVIRTDPRWNRLPILMLSAHTDGETMRRCYAAGADDFLHKPIVETELLTRIQIRLQQRKLWQATEIDPLTGVCLRRKALQELTRLLKLAQKYQEPLSLVVLDLDHFKHVNDQYGHEMGDRVLSSVGKLLRQCFRQEDIIGRWGGAKFVVGMYGTHQEDGRRRVIQVLERLSEYSFITQERRLFKISFSAGIAEFSDQGQELETLYQMADAALYQAKAQGRNCIRLASRA